jgi:hypothetical protein
VEADEVPVERREQGATARRLAHVLDRPANGVGGAHRWLEVLGHAKVGEEDGVGGYVEEDVFQFHVAAYDVFPVNVVESLDAGRPSIEN